MTLYGKRVFAYVIKLRYHPGLFGWPLNPMTIVLNSERQRKKEKKAKTDAEIGVIQPQAKECLYKLEEARRILS